MMKPSNFLAITLLLCIASMQTMVYGGQSELYDDAPQLAALTERTQIQLRAIDFELEKLAQAVNSGAAKIDKKSARNHIAALRKSISQTFDPKRSTPDVQATLSLDRALIDHLNLLTSKDFKDVAVFNADEIAPRFRNTLSADNIEQELANIDSQLQTIRAYINEVGIEPVHTMLKNVETTGKNWGVIKATKKALPYVALGTYWVALTDSKQLPQWAWLQSYKRFIGSLPKVNPTWAVLKKEPKKGEKEPEVDVEKGTKAPAEKPGKPVPVNFDLQQEGPAIMLGETKLISDVHVVPATGALSYVLNNPYLINTGKDSLGLVHWNTAKPVIELTSAMFFGNIIKQDISDLWNWLSTKGNQAWSKAKGESFDDGIPAKSPKYGFSDVAGYEQVKAQLNPIVGYFKEKDMLDRAGSLVSHGYVLVGSLDSAKMLAHGVAKEITANYKKAGKDKECKIWEVNASSLITSDKKKELKEILKDAETYAPCIVIMEELDWLCAQENLDPEMWNKLVNTINGIAKSKKQVFVIATARTRSPIDKALNGAERFGTVISCEVPSLQEREEFFETELGNRCITRSHLNINQYALETNGCEFNDLANIVKQAVGVAHAQQESLKAHHIDQSINELIHRIRTNAVIDPDKKTLLAAHFAGQTLAHALLAPQSKLAKVTILPVDTKFGPKDGALIVYKKAENDLLATEKEIDKNCLIQLAGEQAQRLLLNSSSPALSQAARQTALVEMSKIAFAGIDEKVYPKEQRDALKALAVKKVDQLTQQAAQLLQNNSDALKTLANALAEKAILSADEIATIIE